MTTDVLPVLHIVPRGRTEGCSMWRVWRPTTVLESLGYPCAWDYYDNDKVVDVIPHFRAIVYQRLGWPSVLDGQPWIDVLHRAGLYVWQESDDDMWVNRGDQKGYADLGIDDEKELTAEQNINSTRMYDGVIVSTERLRTVVRSFAPDMPVEVVGNYIDLDLWAALLKGWQRHPALKRRVTVGWFGGNRYDRDFEAMAAGWRMVAKRYPEVTFVIQGYLPPILADAVGRERLEVLPWLPVVPRDGQPFYGVGLLNFDVACCSVADTMFNHSKTPIKFLEATAAGAACVVSRPLYGPLVEHGVTGYIADTPDQWADYIGRLVASKRKRKAMATRAYEYVRNTWSLAENAWRFPAAWAELARAADGRRMRRELVA